MFWWLVVPASAIFVPCVLMPVWEDYRAMLLAEQLTADGVEHMRADIHRLQRHLDGLRNDPGVIARVAMRDLGYRRTDETGVYVAPPAVLAGTPTATSTLEPPRSVVWDRITEWVPLAQYHGIFLDREVRIRLMFLCGAVLVAAFALYPPRSRTLRRV